MIFEFICCISVFTAFQDHWGFTNTILHIMDIQVTMVQEV